MAFDLKTLLSGMAEGLCCEPLPLDLSRAGCAMARFNGWVLPVLPERKHPYRAILRYSSGETRLIESSYPIVFTGVYWRPEASPVAYVRYTARGGKWALNEEVTGGTGVGIMATWECIWADYDVKDSEGNVIRAASEPVEMGG